MIITNEKINKLLVKLNNLKKLSQQCNEKEIVEDAEMLLEIIKQWKYDDSIYDFRNDHYRQSASFLMRIAEETPKVPEYEDAVGFQERFYETMKNYEALKNKYNEREKRRKQ